MNIIENGQLCEASIKKNLFLYLSDDIKECSESDPLYFAKCLKYINEKGDDGFYHLSRKSQIYTNIYFRLEDCLNGIPSQYHSLFEGKFKAIIPSNKEKLVLTVINDDDFFEVTCSHIKIFYDNHNNQQIWNPVNCQYYSHKYTNEEMDKLFKVALLNFNCYEVSPITTYISFIERIPSNFEIKKRRFISTVRPGSNQYKYGLPLWANGTTSKKYKCILKYQDKKINFKIERDDFPMRNITSDRDGGFYVYLEKDIIDGQIQFKTIYDVQSYILSISNSSNINFIDSTIIPKSGIFPYRFVSEIDYNCSIKELFSELAVEDILTECVSYRDNIDASDLEKYKDR